MIKKGQTSGEYKGIQYEVKRVDGHKDRWHWIINGVDSLPEYKSSKGIALMIAHNTIDAMRPIAVPIWMTEKVFNIGYPRMISPNLLAVMVDLQSIVVTDLTGTILCWLHEHTETLTLDKDVTGGLVVELKSESIIAEKVKNYRVVNDKPRDWGIISKFRYPAEQG